MSLKKVYQQLSLYQGNKKYVRETAEQIINDFARYGIDIRFPTNLDFAYNLLYDELLVAIDDLLEMNQTKLMAMLYTIDVPEKEVIKKASLEDTKTMGEVVTELVLEREFKKVLTRHYFKNEANNTSLEV